MKSLEELLLERLEETNKNYACREFAPIIQEWVISEFAPIIQEWVISEFSPEVQKWIVSEFDPEAEKWVKEYLNNKQTSLHIADFCNDNESVPFEFENEQ